MKKKQLIEYRQKSDNELAKRIVQLEREKIETVLQIKMGKIKNVHESARIKKEIAQLKTIVQTNKFKEKEKVKNVAS